MVYRSLHNNLIWLVTIKSEGFDPRPALSLFEAQEHKMFLILL